MTMTLTRVEFDSNAYKGMCDAYRHEDGSITYVVYDDDGSASNPRDDDGNVSSLVQCNSRCIDLDPADSEIAEARDRWRWMDVANSDTSCVGMAGKCTCRNCGDTVPALLRAKGYDHERMVRRYIAICRPDVLFYDGYWSAGDSYGWGYVTRNAWDGAMAPERLSPEQAEALLSGEDVKGVEDSYNCELMTYDQWASGEVYGAWHVWLDGDGHQQEESCWGFLGYDDRKEIAATFTTSPVTEVLA